MFRRFDFPLSDGPTIDMNSRRRTLRFTPLRAGTSTVPDLYTLVRSTVSTANSEVITIASRIASYCLCMFAATMATINKNVCETYRVKGEKI